MSDAPEALVEAVREGCNTDKTRAGACWYPECDCAFGQGYFAGRNAALNEIAAWHRERANGLEGSAGNASGNASISLDNRAEDHRESAAHAASLIVTTE